MADVIKFSAWVEKKKRPPKRYPVRIAGRKKSGQRLTATMKTLRLLHRDAEVLAPAILWLGQIAKRGADPRALVALTEEFVEDYFDELDLAMSFLDEFRQEWRRYLLRSAKPRPIK